MDPFEAIPIAYFNSAVLCNCTATMHKTPVIMHDCPENFMTNNRYKIAKPKVIL